MKTRPIKQSDISAIKRWLKTEQLTMPYNALGVPGVAFAGLRAIDGGYWLFDSMVTNPLCSSATRHAALEAIYKRVFEIAEYSNGIIGLTVDSGALERAKRHGFKQLPHVVLAYTKE